MNSEKKNLLQHLRNLLRYHRSGGIEFYPATQETRSFLHSSISAVSKAPTGQGESFTPPKVEPPDGIAHVPHHGTLEEIATEVQNCQSCDLWHKRVRPVAGKGGRSVKLFVVGGYLGFEQEVAGQRSGTEVFGAEEDVMLARMFKAIHLSSDEVFVSNIIKCGISAMVQPRAENIETCISYLHRQIAASSPQVICTMGMLATRALVEAKKPLSQLRGQFHHYRMGNKQSIPVMPTYHPSFLLKNPEMKRATWSDLQQIEKELHPKPMHRQ